MLMVSAFHVFDFHSYFYGRQLLNSHSVADAKSSKIGIATKGMMSQRVLTQYLVFAIFTMRNCYCFLLWAFNTYKMM